MRRRYHSPANRMSPLHIRNTAAAIGLGKQHPELMLEDEADDPDGHRSDDDQPGQALGIGVDVPADQGAKEGGDDPAPLLQVEDEQGYRISQVEADNKRQVGALGLRLLAHQRGPVAPDPRGDQHRMAQAGKREELEEALDDPDDDRLEVGHVVYRFLGRSQVHGALSSQGPARRHCARAIS